MEAERISISNLAWSKEYEDEVFNLLADKGIKNIEVALSKIFFSVLKPESKEIDAYKEQLFKRNIKVVAYQALLFGSERCALFVEDQERENLYSYLSKVLDLGAELGGKNYVFGSPNNRKRGAISNKEAIQIAVPFFKKLGDLFAKKESYLCIEPNPVVYGSDFITNFDEGIEFIQLINHPNIKLHVDWGAMELTNFDINKLSLDLFVHVHISNPYLKGLDLSQTSEITKLISKLETLNYKNFYSIEIKELETKTEKREKNLYQIQNSIDALIKSPNLKVIT